MRSIYLLAALLLFNGCGWNKPAPNNTETTAIPSIAKPEPVAAKDLPPPIISKPITTIPSFDKIEKLPIPAKFIVSIIPDNAGGIWIGTEDEGIFHYNNTGNNSGEVKQYTTKDGLGDNNTYALALDKDNVLWVGHLNTGVSCFNGKDWQNYDVLYGTIGERVFDIQVCPVDGDVWIATSAGISRYKNKTEDWMDYTREDGLPEDQCSSLSFQKDGTLIIGTQCHGVVVFNRQKDGNYTADKTVSAPDRFGNENQSPVPLEAAGTGLPNNLINKIIVTENDDVYIGTSAGFAQSDKTLQKLEYLRGKNYAEKVRGLWGGAPKDWKECEADLTKQLLPEDYITAIAPAEDGKLWIGFRQKGLILYNPRTKEQKPMAIPEDFVTEIAADEFGNVFAGTYGNGAFKITSGERNPAVNTAAPLIAELPKKRKALTVEQLRTMYYKLANSSPLAVKEKIVTLNDDWRTQGNWIDRYGKFGCVFCAQGGGGFDLLNGYVASEMEFGGWIGRNYKQKGDALRHWLHWSESNDPRVLQCMQLGGRRQAEWDDHKEVYPMTLDGPHVYGTFRMPPGQYIMSLYFFNKDGHQGHNRLRDYIVTVKTMKLSKDILADMGLPGVEAEEDYLRAPKGASLRVKDFWGGVYKRFFVKVEKDECVTVQVNANYSYNTIVSGVFFDPVDELKPIDPTVPLLQPRKPSQWESILNDPSNPQWWWGIKAMDQLLCHRDNDPVRFYSSGRKDVLPLIRHFVQFEKGMPTAPNSLNKEDKELIRANVGRLLRAVQLFGIADKVDFTDKQYTMHDWEERTKLGRDKVHAYEGWDWDKFREFSKKRIKQQTW